jgi:hypothetical protein
VSIRSTGAAISQRPNPRHQRPGVFYSPIEFEAIEELLEQLPETAIAPAKAYLDRRLEKLTAIYGER